MIKSSSFEFREASMTPSPQENQADNGEMASLLLGAGFALASLIILPAVAQRIGPRLQPDHRPARCLDAGREPRLDCGFEPRRPARRAAFLLAPAVVAAPRS
jgi:hypothetical protein